MGILAQSAELVGISKQFTESVPMLTVSLLAVLLLAYFGGRLFFYALRYVVDKADERHSAALAVMEKRMEAQAAAHHSDRIEFRKQVMDLVQEVSRTNAATERATVEVLTKLTNRLEDVEMALINLTVEDREVRSEALATARKGSGS